MITTVVGVVDVADVVTDEVVAVDVFDVIVKRKLSQMVYNYMFLGVT